MLDLVNSPTQQIRLRTVKAAELRGKFIGRSSGAAAVVVLWPETSQEEGLEIVILIPGPDGRFVQDTLRPGHYRVHWAEKATWEVGPWRPDAPATIEIQLFAGGVTRLELPL
jgi:hypothetical protein